MKDHKDIDNISQQQQQRFKKPNCLQHRLKEATHVLHNESELIFICSNCISTYIGEPSFTVISFDSIFSDDSNLICSSWPPIYNPKIFQEYQKEINDFVPVESIEQIFADLQNELISSLEKKKQQTIARAKEFQNFKNELIDNYHSAAQMEVLRTYVENSFDSQEGKKQLIGYMNDKINQKIDISMRIEGSLRDFKNIKSKFQMADLKSFCQNLIKKVENFSVYPQIEKRQQNEISELQLNLNRLLSNKTNFITQQFLSEFNEAYEEVSYVFESTINPKHIFQDNPIQFQLLQDHQFETVQTLVQRMLNQVQNSERPTRQVSQILQLVNNKFNFLNQKFIEDLKSTLVIVGPIFNTLNVTSDYLYQNGRDPQYILNYLQDTQVSNIFKLCEAILMRSQQGRFQDSREMTNIVYKNLAPLCTNREKLKQILHQFPIFDFMQREELIESSIMPQIFGTIERNAYNDSSKLLFEQKQLDKIQIQNYSNSFGGVYFKYDLEPGKKYVIRFRFDNDLPNFIIIGVVPKDNAAITQLSNTFQGKILGTISNNYCSEVVKGKLLNFDVRQCNTMEMRVDLSENNLLFLDYPYYRNINQLEKSRQLDPNQIYHLAVQFGQGQQYCISINLIYFQEVEYFENNR